MKSARLGAVSVLLPMLAAAQDLVDPDIDIPPGPGTPLVIEMKCQSEVCLPGAYLACRRLELTNEPGPGSRVMEWLDRGDRFRVVAARTVVLSPGVVRVTRDVSEVFGRPVAFEQGEFLFLLDYHGEGWYGAWRDGEIIEVEQFWPSNDFGPGRGFEYGGELIREGVTEIWHGVETDGQPPVWVRGERGSMLDPLQISIARTANPLDACPESDE